MRITHPIQKLILAVLIAAAAAIPVFDHRRQLQLEAERIAVEAERITAFKHAAHDAVIDRYSLLPESDSQALEGRLIQSGSESEFEGILREPELVRGYLRRLIRLRLDGQLLPANQDSILQSMLEAYPEDVDPKDFRTLLYGNYDHWNTNTYLVAMGKSGNKEYIADVRKFLPNAAAMSSYAQLAGRDALPILLAYLDLTTTETPYHSADVMFLERAIEDIGLTRDPSLLPLLNDIGERQQNFRDAVERAVDSIAEANLDLCVPVAANLFSLPKAYPPEGNLEYGRWFSNAHIPVRNLLERACEKRGIPLPADMSEAAWSAWWERNRSKFQSIEEIHRKYDRQYYLNLQAQGRAELRQRTQ